MPRALALLLAGLALLALAWWGSDRLLPAAEPAALPGAGPSAPATDLDGPAVLAREPSEAADERAAVEAGPAAADTPTLAEREAELADPAVVVARLVDDAGRPVPGGVLATQHQEGERGGADGIVRLEVPRNRVSRWRGQWFPYELRASAPGRATWRQRVATPPGETTDLGDLELAPGGALRGRVLDAAGAPAAGAVVEVTPPPLGAAPADARLAGPGADELDRTGATTDAEGAYRVTGVPAGTLRVWARAADGLWTFSEPVEVPAGGEGLVPDLVLRAADPGRVVAGRVVGPTGAPVAGAFVLGSGVIEKRVVSKHAEAGDDGRFVLPAVTDGPLRVKAYHPRRAMRPTIVETRSGARDVEIVLGELRHVEVRAVDARSGAPVDSPSVWVNDDSYFQDYLGAFDEVPRLAPEVDGAVARVPVRQHTFRISISKTGYDSLELGPFDPATAPAELEARLEPLARLRGVVLAEGEPVEGAEVQVNDVMGSGFPLLTQGFRTRLHDGASDAVRTDAEGRFNSAVVVRSDFADAQVLLVTHEEWSTAELPLDGSEDELVVHLTRGGAIEGQVLLTAGSDAQGGVVAASRGDGLILTAHADGEGRYRFERLTPGPWEVRYHEESQELTMSVAREPWPGPYAGDCEVREGATTRHDLDERGTLTTVAGRLAFDGAPAAGWTARLEPGTSWGYGDDGPSTLLDADGRYALELRAGRARLVLEAPAGEVHVVLARELTLEGGLVEPLLDLTTGTLTVRADDEATVSVRRAVDGFAYDASAPLEAGARTFPAVPAGTADLYRRTPRPGGWSAWEPTGRVAVPAGGAASATVGG